MPPFQPANNYYFRWRSTAKPRIFRAWIAIDELAPAALEVNDWEGMDEIVRRADDAITALPLYTSPWRAALDEAQEERTLRRR